MIKGQVIPNYRCETPESLINMSIIDSEKNTSCQLGLISGLLKMKTARKI